jgi:hypothetical protein
LDVIWRETQMLQSAERETSVNASAKIGAFKKGMRQKMVRRRVCSLGVLRGFQHTVRCIGQGSRSPGETGASS